MTVLLSVVEGPNFVGMRHSLRELPQPIVADASIHMSRNQQVSVACNLRDIQHLLRPREGLRHAPLREGVAGQPPKDGWQRVVALERLRQAKCRMQVGPYFRGRPSS